MTENPQATTAPELALKRDALLAQKFVELADTLVDDFDIVELMDTLIEACIDLLGASAAGLLLADGRGELQVVACSSDDAWMLELFQLQSDEGPCLDCVHESAPVTVDNISGETARWPRFVDAAAGIGYLSVQAVPLRLRNETIGGLNLFKTSAPPLSVDDQRIAQALADVATIGILQQRSVHRAALMAEQLQSALNSRVAIEQAKGVLAEYAGLEMAAAFSALRWYARDRNRKVVDLADDVVSGRVDLAEIIRSSESHDVKHRPSR